MERKKIYLSSPTMHGDEQRFVQEAFDTNWVAPLGPNVNAFEQELAAYTGCGHAAALSSGTAAQNAAQEIMLNARADGSARASFVRAVQLFRQPEGNGLLNGQTWIRGHPAAFLQE